MYNIANVGWQLVHYTVYGTQKSDNGLGVYPFSSSRKLYSGLATIQYLYNIKLWNRLKIPWHVFVKFPDFSLILPIFPKFPDFSLQGFFPQNSLFSLIFPCSGHPAKHQSQGTKWALAHSHLRVGEAPGEYPSVCTGPYYRVQKKKKKKELVLSNINFWAFSLPAK